MKIAFVWYWDQASEMIDKWRDGLRAAMEIIAKDNEVVWFLDKKVPDLKDNFDIILLWSDDNCEFIQELPKYSAKKGLCLTTNPHNPGNLLAFDAVFCESTPVLQEVRNLGIKGVKAFGTDTDFFTPKGKKKYIKYLYPATFSPWKRQSEIAYLGKDLWCIGTLQSDGEGELNACIEEGVHTIVEYMPVKRLLKYYRDAENVVIPAVHGSERTVLESMSCGIKPVVIHPLENKKANSYILELEESKLSPREFVIKNYSAQKYADTIMEALK